MKLIFFNSATGIFLPLHSSLIKKNFRRPPCNSNFWKRLKEDALFKPSLKKAGQLKKYAKNRLLTLKTFFNLNLNWFSNNFKITVAKFNLVKSFKRYGYLKIYIFPKIGENSRIWFGLNSNCPKILLEVFIPIYIRVKLISKTIGRVAPNP